jgi:uncharacterized membrane protein
LRLVDAPAIEVAIARAEARTSGEIRVSVAPWFWGNERGTAELAFHRLGMDATHERNTVLIFVVPARRSFAVIGDSGIHARVGAQFWVEIGDRLGAAFRVGRYTEGLVAEIDALGERLARDFPIDAHRHLIS